MSKVLAALVVFTSLSAGCIFSPGDEGSTGGSGSIATATSGGGTTIGGGTMTGASGTGTSGTTGGLGIDGGAVMGIACGDAGACAASQYCVKSDIQTAGVDVIKFKCDAIPSCNAEPDCACFTSIDAGICYWPHTLPECDVVSGMVECRASFP